MQVRDHLIQFKYKLMQMESAAASAAAGEHRHIREPMACLTAYCCCHRWLSSRGAVQLTLSAITQTDV